MSERSKPAAREYALGLLLGLLLALVGNLAVDHAERVAPPGQVPVGVLADDHMIYLSAVYGSFAREAAEGGGISVHNHQTSAPHGDVLDRPWDWLVGCLGRAFELSPRGLFHLDRWLACLLLGPALVFVLGELLGRTATRRWALVAVCAGGSLYWLVELPFVGREGGAALRTWLDATHPRLSGLGFAPPALALGAPHVLLELVFFSASLGLLLRAARARCVGYALAAGLAILLQSWVRPYTVPVHFGVALALFGPGLWRAARWKSAALLACSLGPCLPHLWHLWEILRGETVFSRLNVVHPAPPLLEQLLFQGWPAFVAPLLLLPAVRRRRREAGVADGLAARALLVGVACNLALVNGEPVVRWGVEAMLPLFLFSVVLAARVAEAFEPALARRWLAAALVLQCLPTLFLALDLQRGLAQEGGALYVSDDEQAAFEWISEVRPEGSLTSVTAPMALVCDPSLGVLVPWLGGVRTLIGHQDHTPRWSQLERLALRGYYRFGVGVPELAEAGATHILWGPRERRHRAPTSQADPGKDERLELVWSEGSVSVYSILRAPVGED